MSLEETIEDTPEYKALYEHYPHITKSIRLRREKKRLKKLNSLDKGSVRLYHKRQMLEIKEHLDREKTFKRLFGENKQEKIFNRRFKFENIKENVSSLNSSLNRTFNNTIKKIYGNLRSFNQRKSRLLHRNLLPTLFDLRSLDVNEKGLAVREWIYKNDESRQTN
jgi:hypothetical protein